MYTELSGKTRRRVSGFSGKTRRRMSGFQCTKLRHETQCKKGESFNLITCILRVYVWSRRYT